MNRRLVAGLVVLVFSALSSEGFVLKRRREASAGLDAGCDCDGKVRLVGGRHRFEGKVEVCESGEWNNICIFFPDQDWTVAHGQVVCRYLNYSTEGAEIVKFSNNESESLPHLTYKCSGSEDNFTQCDQNEYKFVCRKVGKVVCQVPEDQKECTNEGEVRLVNGDEVSTAQGKGRVEVCSHSGLWGTVCDDEWDDEDASVVCRGLGFNGTGHTAVTDVQVFGPGEELAHILYNNVECSGNEANITSCPHSSEDTDILTCDHDEDAAVICAINDRDNKTTPTSPTTTCGEVCRALVIGLICVGVTAIVATGVAIGVLIRNRIRMKKRRMPVPAEYSEYVPTNTSRHSSIQLDENLPARLRAALEAYIIDVSQLEIGESLGEGCFGTVHKGVYRSESEEIVVAIKTIKSGNNVQDFISECVVMKDFDHPNILGLVGVSFDETACLPLVVLPFMANGDLRHFLHSKHDFNHDTVVSSFPEGIDLSFLLHLCRDISRGMEYLASNKFVHRDLAARNCMVTDDFTVKVADFGLSRDIYSKDYYKTKTRRLMPVKWMAPESLSANIFTEKSDVWSFGVVCWEVFSLGSTPYPGVGNHEVSDYIGGGHRLKIPRLCPREIYQTVELCWSASPDERPDFSHLVQVFESLVESPTQSQSSSSPYYVNIAKNGHSQCNGTQL